MLKGLPEKLKNLRAQHNYSQKQVAELLNVSPSSISGYEIGERTPSTENLLALSYLYHCSTDYLLGRQTGGAALTIDVNGLNDQQIRAHRPCGVHSKRVKRIWLKKTSGR